MEALLQTFPWKEAPFKGTFLSPFLFFLYSLQPLLRLLHVVGRGYKFGHPATNTPQILTYGPKSITSAVTDDEVGVLDWEG